MGQREFCSPSVVEHHICNALDVTMSCDCDDRYGKRMFERRINTDQAFSTLGDQLFAILFDQIGAVPMVRCEIEIARVYKVIAYTRHDSGMVSIAKLGHENAEGQCAPAAKGTGKKIWLVVELLRGLFNPFSRLVWNGAARRVIENDRYGGRIQA